MRVGVIRVLTTDDRELLNAHGRALEAEFGFETISCCIPNQPTGVHNAETFALAVPKVAALAAGLAPLVDAIIVSCAADPGLAEARAASSVPVVGAGSEAAERALSLGQSVGVLDLTVETPVSITALLGDRRVASLVPDGVTETRDLLTDAGRNAAIAGAHELVNRGADVLLLACTGMTSIALAATLASELDVPVVDAVLAAGAAVESILSAGAAGESRRGAGALASSVR
jgi:allantoin racemase